MKNYFLGLDGGGTKTHIVLYSPDDNLMDLYTGGASNYENMPRGYEELAEVLKDMFDNFLGKHGLTPKDIKRAAFGMGGVDTTLQHTEISKVLTGLGFNNYVLNNDAFLGVKAGASHGVGISCVSGSGFSVVGIGDGDTTLQTNGMGTYTGDSGGSCWLVPEAVRYIHGQLFRRYPATSMTERLKEIIGFTGADDFMDLLHERGVCNYKPFALAVGKMVFEEAAKGDGPAINLLETSGQAYGESILGILDRLSFMDPPEIILTGSLFQKNPDSPMVTRIQQFLEEHYDRPFILTTLDSPSVLGALVWALGDEAHGKRDALKSQLLQML